MRRVLNSLAARVDPAVHPLLDERKTPKAGGKTLLIVVTADRGLCGSFNTNVIKGAGQFITENAARQVALGLVGRRGRDYFGKRGFEVRYEQVNLFGALKFEHGQAIARAAMEAFLQGEVDSVYIIYNEFKSVMVQRVVVEQLLPIPRQDLQPAEGSATPIEDLYEPSAEELFQSLLPAHVEVQVFRALLESNAAFFAAQMTAMDAATRNSGEMIESLTLYMNKVRQAAITREIIEVVSGAQAL
jgi:F-type H+-transporting ATPase subunit gamma